MYSNVTVELLDFKVNVDLRFQFYKLENCLRTNNSNVLRKNLILEQDNEQTHKSCYTKEWLASSDIGILCWPARLSELKSF